MGVAEQMLLNQVTIFNPPSTNNRSNYEVTKSNSKIEAGSTPLVWGDVSRTPSDYAFGWKDPREIVEDK